MPTSEACLTRSNLATLRAEPTTFWGLPDGLRPEVAGWMIGFGLDPTEYFHWEVGEVIDAIADAADALRERLAATPGLVVE